MLTFFTFASSFIWTFSFRRLTSPRQMTRGTGCRRSQGTAQLMDSQLISASQLIQGTSSDTWTCPLVSWRLLPPWLGCLPIRRIPLHPSTFIYPVSHTICCYTARIFPLSRGLGCHLLRRLLKVSLIWILSVSQKRNNVSVLTSTPLLRLHIDCTCQLLA